MNKQEQLDYLAKHAGTGERLGLGNLKPLLEAMIEAQPDGTPEIYAPVLKFSKIGVDKYAYVGDTLTLDEYRQRVTADVTGTPAVRVALVPLRESGIESGGETGGWTGSDPMTSSDPWTETDPMTSSDPWTETDPMTRAAAISADAAEAPEIKPLTLSEIAGFDLNTDLPATVILFTHVEVSDGSVVAIQDDAQGGQWRLKVTAAAGSLTYLTPPEKLR